MPNYISSITLPDNSNYIIKDANAIRKNGVSGDIMYWSTTDTPTRLNIGADGKILKSNGSTPEWSDEYKVEIIDFKEAT